jgi:hypothetical protein
MYIFFSKKIIHTNLANYNNASVGVVHAAVVGFAPDAGSEDV